MRIPTKGIAQNELFETMEEYRALDMPSTGRTFGYVYDAGKAAEEIGKKAFVMFMSKNALDPTVYPSVLRFETEVVRMATEHLHGDENVAGNFTSGGTESIMLAVKTARDHALANNPELTEPEMIVPITAHAAFHKAAHYLGVKLVPAPIDPKTFKADVEAMKKLITASTILLVASAPSYAHGVVDPIPELGQLALEKKLLLHVDGCIGAFLLPYFERLGDDVTPFDFRVPGVTSISMDLHKYAYCPKGASVILYRDKELRKHQLFSCAAWTGYTMINTTVQSTKSAGPMAAAWAVLNFIGDEGYLDLSRSVRDATRRLVEGISKIDGLEIMGEPEMSLMAVASETLSVFHVIDLMKKRGWYIQPQLAYEDHRESFHLSIQPSNVEWVEPFLEDLKVCAAEAAKLPSSDLAPQIKQMFSSIDPDSLDQSTFQQILGMAGIGDYSVPDEMAEINEIMNALPPRLSERLLTEFVNELFIYQDKPRPIAPQAEAQSSAAPA